MSAAAVKKQIDQVVEPEVVPAKLPAIVARKMTLGDLMSRGPALMAKLVAKWPSRAPATWAGLLRAWLADNSMWLGVTDRAEMIAQAGSDPMTGQTEVRVLAVFVADPKLDELHVNRLWRECEAWARGLRATRISADPSACEIAPSRLGVMTKAESRPVYARALD